MGDIQTRQFAAATEHGAHTRDLRGVEQFQILNSCKLCKRAKHATRISVCQNPPITIANNNNFRPSSIALDGSFIIGISIPCFIVCLRCIGILKCDICDGVFVLSALIPVGPGCHCCRAFVGQISAGCFGVGLVDVVRVKGDVAFQIAAILEHTVAADGTICIPAVTRINSCQSAAVIEHVAHIRDIRGIKAGYI